MLAQNFKSADELGITYQQKEALMKTLVLMETGRLIHVERPNVVSPDDAKIFTSHFNMDKWNVIADCGSVCCIGGTAEMVGQLQPYSLHEAAGENQALRLLFYPDGGDSDWKTIIPAQAATALRSYLTTGDSRWDLAVA